MTRLIVMALLGCSACASARPYMSGEQITSPLNRHVIGGSVSLGGRWVF